MLLDIIIDTLLFGASGYVTNKYVMNMLFKEYPFVKNLQVGGKVKASKKQFVQNVSNMMEKDIINSEKISDRFKEHNFNEEFSSFSKDFIDKFVCRETRSLRLKDIPVFHDACYGIRDIVINLVNTNISDILNNLGSSIKLSELITKNQAEHLSKVMLQNLVLTIKNTDIIENIILTSSENFNNIKLSDIISKDISELIKSNISKKAINFEEIIRANLSERIDSSINEILKQNKLESILMQVQDEISKKPLKTFININTQEMAGTFRENIIEFINSEKGEKLLADMYYDLKDYIINSNLNLYNLFKTDYEESIQERTNNRLNSITYSILKWIESNNSDLESSIKESIADVITGHTELKNKIFSTFKNYFNNKKNEDGKIISILLESENNNENLNKISSYIITETSNYLMGVNAKSIINSFEEKQIFNSGIFINSIIKYVKNIDNSTIETFFNDAIALPLNYFINIDLTKLFNDKLKYIFIDYIKQNTYYSTELLTDIASKVTEYIFTSFNETIGDLLDQDYLVDKSNRIKKLILKNIAENENQIIDAINSKINQFVNNSNISSVFDKMNEFNQSSDIIVAEKINELLQQNFLKIVDDIGDIRISKLLTKLSSIPNIHSSLSDFMKSVVGESIAFVSEGYISEIVETHFDKQNELEFAWHIKNTNSININKINLSGGIIGASIALPLSIISDKLLSCSIINNVFSWKGMVLGSIIGLSTNFIAMNPFSKCYSESSILAKIPILTNYKKKSILKKQSIFADYMANIVESNLIDENTIEDLIQSKSIQLKRNIANSISVDDYKQIYNFFDNNKVYLSDKLSSATLAALTNKTESLAEYISESISDIPIKMLINRNLIDSIMSLVASNKDKLLSSSLEYFNNNIFDNLTISTFIPEKILDKILDRTDIVLNDSFYRISDFLKETEYLRRYLIKHENSYKNFLDKNLIDTFSSDTLDDLYYKIFSSLYSHLFTDDNLSILSDITYQGLSKEFIGNKKLDKLFDRRTKFILSSMFFKYFKDLVIDLHQYMSLNRAVIENDIREALLSNLNLKEKLSYNAVGADNAIHNIVNNLIQIKLPLFIERNLEQFYEISKSITEDILDVYLNDLGMSLDKDKTSSYVKDLFVVKNRNSIIKNKSFLIFNTYMKKYNEIKTIEFAKNLHLGNINEIFAYYENEISYILKHLTTNIKRNKNNIIKISSGIFEQSSIKILDSILVKDLFIGLSDSDLINMKNYFDKTIEDNDLLYLNINAFINSFYNYLDDRDLLDTIVDINDFKTALNSSLNKLSESKKFEEYINDLFTKIITDDLKFSIYVNIGNNVKHYFTDILADGFYLSIKNNLGKIYSSIRLDEITREEIMKLPLQQFQDLYNIFWLNNYRNTVWTGLLGGIFGANRIAGVLLIATTYASNALKTLKSLIKFIFKPIKILSIKIKEKLKSNNHDKK